MADIKKILIVDDSAVERFHLNDMLSKQGFKVIEAADGEEAVNKAKDQHPDLILMDIVMPGMSGFQITRQLARDESLASIPVIMCTSKDSETDRVWGMRQGAKGYLIKPIKADSLFGLIDRLNRSVAIE
jgi:twitching motility two-component system response regulator PilH